MDLSPHTIEIAIEHVVVAGCDGVVEHEFRAGLEAGIASALEGGAGFGADQRGAVRIAVEWDAADGGRALGSAVAEQLCEGLRS